MIKKIIVFGDSISSGSNDWEVGGWIVRLKNYFAKTGQFCHVFDLTISGENSSQIIERMEMEMKPRITEDPKKKSLILVGVPIVDTKIAKALDANPEISIEKFRENLEKAYDAIKKNTDNIVFIGMTKVDEKKLILGKRLLNAE
ncbi:MAG: hypothetical protein PF549_02295 [Patescibacteria group bacterium]|jgi:hypothetical protein|nr:hypothetical protein [Patescibacteria group bacterium]